MTSPIQKVSFRVRPEQMAELRRVVAHAQHTDLTLSLDGCVRDAIDEKIADLKSKYGLPKVDERPRRGPAIKLD